MIESRIKGYATEQKLYLSGSIPLIIPLSYTMQPDDILNVSSIYMPKINNKKNKFLFFLRYSITPSSGSSASYIVLSGGATNIVITRSNGGSDSLSVLARVKNGYFTVDFVNTGGEIFENVQPYTEYFIHYYIFNY